MKYEDSFKKNNDLEVCFKELGGELASIKDQEGIEYLWQGDAQYWSGQAPVLFPICGSVRNDTTMYRPQGVGKIPRHGLVRKKNFELVEQTEDRVTFGIEDTEEMYQQYPYHFRLEITYQLLGKKIQVTYRVYHLGEEGVMPFFSLVAIQDLIVRYWWMKDLKITTWSSNKKRPVAFQNPIQRQAC